MQEPKIQIIELQVDHQGSILFVRHFQGPPEMPHVILIHDIGGSHKSLLELESFFLHDGYGLTTVDLRSHGFSSGSLGEIAPFERNVLDLVQLFSFVQNKANGPIFVICFGLSCDYVKSTLLRYERFPYFHFQILKAEYKAKKKAKKWHFVIDQIMPLLPRVKSPYFLKKFFLTKLLNLKLTEAQMRYPFKIGSLFEIYNLCLTKGVGKLERQATLPLHKDQQVLFQKIENKMNAMLNQEKAAL